MAARAVSAQGLAAWPQRNTASVFTGSYYGYPVGGASAHPESPFPIPCSSCGSETFWTKRENFIFAFATLLATAIISETLHQVRIRRSIGRRRQPPPPPDDESEFSTLSESRSSSTSSSKSVKAYRGMGRTRVWDSESEDDYRPQGRKPRRADHFRSRPMSWLSSEKNTLRRVDRRYARYKRPFRESPLFSLGARNKLRRLQNTARLFQLNKIAKTPGKRHKDAKLKRRRRTKKTFFANASTASSFPLQSKSDIQKVNSAATNTGSAKTNDGTKTEAPVNLISARAPAIPHNNAVTHAQRGVYKSRFANENKMDTARPAARGGGRIRKSSFALLAGHKGGRDTQPTSFEQQASSRLDTHHKHQRRTASERMPSLVEGASFNEVRDTVRIAANQTKARSASAYAAENLVTAASSARRDAAAARTSRKVIAEPQSSDHGECAALEECGEERDNIRTGNLKAAFKKLFAKAEACDSASPQRTTAASVSQGESQLRCDVAKAPQARHELKTSKREKKASAASQVSREHDQLDVWNGKKRLGKQQQQSSPPTSGGALQQRPRRRKRRRRRRPRLQKTDYVQRLKELSLAGKPLCIAVFIGLYSRVVNVARFLAGRVPRFTRTRLTKRKQ